MQEKERKRKRKEASKSKSKKHKHKKVKAEGCVPGMRVDGLIHAFMLCALHAELLRQLPPSSKSAYHGYYHAGQEEQAQEAQQ